MDKHVVLDAVQAENKKMCCAPKELTVSYKHSPISVITVCSWNLSDSFKRREKKRL